MKNKILFSLLIVLTLFIITGCGTENKITNNSNNSSTKIKENSKSVVLYFSATGTTKSIAEKIAKESSSDIIEIIPKEKYKSEDLDYNNDCRANREQNDSKSRPEIENKIDISKYNTIYLGYPI